MTDYEPALLTIIAGPNGSGKSTLAAALGLGAAAASSVPFINPDNIASSINPTHPAHVAVEAGREALRQQLYYLERGKSFAIETTLAGRSPFRMMRRARHYHFVLHLVFVAVEEVQTNLDRIAVRVAGGGHHIPDADVRRRYERSMANLEQAVALADRATIIDNSGEVPREVLILEHQRIVRRADDLPDWLMQALGSLLGKGGSLGGIFQVPNFC